MVQTIPETPKENMVGKKLLCQILCKFEERHSNHSLSLACSALSIGVAKFPARIHRNRHISNVQ
jgi:hypothetical protein